MDLLVVLYIANTVILLLHEIDSAYWKEWEIFSPKGKPAGFILLHIPMIALMLWGLLELHDRSVAGYVLALIAAVGGFLPVLVHKLFFKTPDKFNTEVSSLIIYSSIVSGALLLAATILSMTGNKLIL
jgi:hypothetical protein